LIQGHVRVAGLALLVGVLAGPARGEEPLYYEEREGRVVFTNTPPSSGARVLPGFDAPAPAVEREHGKAPLPSTIYDAFIERLAREYGVSADLIKAIAVVESDLNPHAVSRKGAMGLMQLMPGTARDHGVRDAFDPLENLRGGAQYLSALLRRFDENLDLALAAYNAGPEAVRRHGGVPSYPETTQYIRRVRQRLGRSNPPPPAPSRAKQSPPKTEELVTETAGASIVHHADGRIELVN
jgi:soluble lytic murein transglycosylase-like protein